MLHTEIIASSMWIHMNPLIQISDRTFLENEKESFMARS